MPIKLGDLEKRIDNLQAATGDSKLAGRARIALGDLTKANDSIERKTGWDVDLTDGVIQGGAELDASISMGSEYSTGHVQELAERTLAWYAITDADGKFPVGFFGDDATEPQMLNAENYRGWVGKHVPPLGNTNLFAGIYTIAQMAADALNEPRILDLVAHEPFDHDDYDPQVRWTTPYSDLEIVPVEQIFHGSVDGDGGRTVGPRNPFIEELIIRMSYTGIFLKFKYIGDDPDGKRFLKKLDDLKQRKHPQDSQRGDVGIMGSMGRQLRWIDNVDTVEFPSGLRGMTDQAFSAAMTQELDTYLPSAIKRGILVPA